MKGTITPEDNPAVIINLVGKLEYASEWDMKYGIDYSIRVFDWNEDNLEFIPAPEEVVFYNDHRQKDELTNNCTRANVTEITKIADYTAHNKKIPGLMIMISPLKTSLYKKWKKYEIHFHKEMNYQALYCAVSFASLTKLHQLHNSFDLKSEM